LRCDGLCIAISSLYFVEFLEHNNTLKIPSPLTGQVEQQNKEPQNDEVITSIFDPPEADSIFCGLKEFYALNSPTLVKVGLGGF